MLNNLASGFRQKQPVGIRATVDLNRANPVSGSPVGRSVLSKQLLLLYGIAPLLLLFIIKSQQRVFSSTLLLETHSAYSFIFSSVYMLSFRPSP